jgi:hypothetical protein
LTPPRGVGHRLLPPYTRSGLGTGGSALFNTLAAVAAVVAGMLLITIIQRITRRQRDRYSELLGGV